MDPRTLLVEVGIRAPYGNSIVIRKKINGPTLWPSYPTSPAPHVHSNTLHDSQENSFNVHH